MLLQAMVSLISIKESDKKEKKINTPWQHIGKISLLFTIQKEKISIKKEEKFGGGNIVVLIFLRFKVCVRIPCKMG